MAIRTVPRSTDRAHDEPSSDAQRTRAMIAIPELSDLLLGIVAFGNEDEIYGKAAQAEMDRRERM